MMKTSLNERKKEKYRYIYNNRIISASKSIEILTRYSKSMNILRYTILPAKSDSDVVFCLQLLSNLVHST